MSSTAMATSFPRADRAAETTYNYSQIMCTNDLPDARQRQKGRGFRLTTNNADHGSIPVMYLVPIQTSEGRIEVLAVHRLPDDLKAVNISFIGAHTGYHDLSTVANLTLNGIKPVVLTSPSSEGRGRTWGGASFVFACGSVGPTAPDSSPPAQNDIPRYTHMVIQRN